MNLSKLIETWSQTFIFSDTVLNKSQTSISHCERCENQYFSQRLTNTLKSSESLSNLRISFLNPIELFGILRQLIFQIHHLIQYIFACLVYYLQLQLN